ncbi:MAPEG family [Lactarius tabidus]
MSSVAINIPAGYSWVLVSIFSIIPVLHFQSSVVVRARRAAGIRYPQLYAEKAQQEVSKDAMKFNCAQRAHQNTLENVPLIVLSTLISAIHHPTYAAVGCGIWSFGRILYTLGYSTGEPNGVCFYLNSAVASGSKHCVLAQRLVGSFTSLGVQALLGLLAGKVVFDVVQAGV